MNKKQKQLAKAKLQKKQPPPTQVQISGSKSFSGPIPDPQTLAHYGNISPDFPDRILALAEREAGNRHKIEGLALDANIILNNRKFSERRLGQVIGSIITIGGLSCSAYLGSLGLETAATAVGTTTVVTLAAIFVLGKFKKDSSS